MLRFIARRLAIAVGLLLVLSVLMYWLLDIALDPLDDPEHPASPATASSAVMAHATTTASLAFFFMCFPSRSMCVPRGRR